MFPCVSVQGLTKISEQENIYVNLSLKYAAHGWNLYENYFWMLNLLELLIIIIFHTTYFWYRISCYAATKQMLSQFDLYTENCVGTEEQRHYKFLCWAMLSDDIILNFCNSEKFKEASLYFCLVFSSYFCHLATWWISDL